MSSVKSYAASFDVDSPIRGGIVARVIESRSKSLQSGDTVVGYCPGQPIVLKRRKTSGRSIQNHILPVIIWEYWECRV